MGLGCLGTPLRAAAVLLSLWLVACGGVELEPGMPPELVGRWVTDAPAFEGRYLEITPEHIVFGTGGLPDLNTVDGVEPPRAEKAATRHVIHYFSSHGYSAELELLYTDRPRPTLRVGQRPELWTRES